MEQRRINVFFLKRIYGLTVILGGGKNMRRWKNEWLKEFSVRKGLEEGASILVRERSLLKDGSYITRKRRYGVVLQLYPYHFYCMMEDGTRESFRYNEFLGYESRLVRLKGSVEGNMNDCQLNQLERASTGRFFYLEKKKALSFDKASVTRTVGFEPTRRLPDLSDFESELFNHLSTSPYN